MIYFTRVCILNLIALLAALLPEPAVRRLGWGLAYTVSFACRRRMRIVKRHVARILGPDADIRHSAREIFGYYGQYWAELLWLRSHGVKACSVRTTIDGIEELRKAKAACRGMIFAVPHIGSWDMLGILAHQEKIEITVVGELLPERRMGSWLVKLRRDLGMEVMDADDQSLSTPALVKRLRAGGAVVIISDRDPTGTGVQVRFFGEETHLPARPATLAELTGAPIFPLAVYFLPGGKHRLVIRKPLEPTTTGHLEQRVHLRTQRLALALETLVREAPSQWHLVRANWPSDDNPSYPP